MFVVLIQEIFTVGEIKEIIDLDSKTRKIKVLYLFLRKYLKSVESQEYLATIRLRLRLKSNRRINGKLSKELWDLNIVL